MQWSLEIDPNYANALWFLALSLKQKGELSEAITNLEKAVSVTHGSYYQALLGRAYALAGERTKAAESRNLIKGGATVLEPRIAVVDSLLPKGFGGMDMKAVFINAFLALAALILAACGRPEKSTDTNTSAAATKPAAAAATPDALLALDKQANAAYLTSDSKFFEGMLNEKFVAREGGRQMDKAAFVKLVAGNKCNVNDWKLEDPLMAKIDADTYVLSYRGTFDGSCIGPDGRPIKIPSPIRAATVWVRAGNAWRAAFHGQDPIFDPQKPPSLAKAVGEQESKKGDRALSNAKVAADLSTVAMMAIEKSVWQAWMAKDAAKLEELTTPDLSFQNIYGAYFANKADTIKSWTSAYCDIKSVSVTDGEGTLLSPTIGILNRTGTAEGSCNGQKLSPVPIHGTSVYVKDGDSWKLAFSLNRLD